MKILLINPGRPENSGRDLYDAAILAEMVTLKPNKRIGYGLPLALPTLAGCTPSEHQVTIVDESIEDIDFDAKCDLVGITAMTYKAPRAYEIAAQFKKRGVPVVMGGIHASMCPDEASEHVDSVVIGEAEEIWPLVLADFQQGMLRPRYQMEDFPDISKLPPPRTDLTKYDQYGCFFLQTSRGCPYKCNFCTVTQFNGKKLRKKTPEQVIAEVRKIVQLKKDKRVPMRNRATGKSRLYKAMIFFTDDNFARHKEHALAICEALTRYQREEGILINWTTQVNLSAALDEELMIKMSEAGCRFLFMGVESLSPEGLKLMNKTMNSPELYGKAIEIARRHGIETYLSFVLGTDADDEKTVDRIVEFVSRHDVFYILPNILTPYPGTQLREQMEKDGRILTDDHSLYNIRNVVFQPKKMSPSVLMEQYERLCSSLFSYDAMKKRGEKALNSPYNTYVFSPFIRLILWNLFSFTAVQIAARGRIRRSILCKMLLAAPRTFLLSSNPFSLPYLAACADYDDFAQQERLRISGSSKRSLRQKMKSAIAGSFPN